MEEYSVGTWDRGMGVWVGGGEEGVRVGETY